MRELAASGDLGASKGSFNRMMNPLAACAYLVEGNIFVVAGHLMETKIAQLVVFAMTAGMAAITLLFIMHFDFGLARLAIRTDALISAVITGVLAVAWNLRQ